MNRINLDISGNYRNEAEFRNYGGCSGCGDNGDCGEGRCDGGCGDAKEVCSCVRPWCSGCEESIIPWCSPCEEEIRPWCLEEECGRGIEPWCSCCEDGCEGTGGSTTCDLPKCFKITVWNGEFAVFGKPRATMKLRTERDYIFVHDYDKSKHELVLKTSDGKTIKTNEKLSGSDLIRVNAYADGKGSAKGGKVVVVL